MKVYGFVGSSGTGKSYRALGLASERGIECIIDDGLLIKSSKVIAGYSAKKESTKVAAVKRALFMDKNHANSVREAISAVQPDSMLILGTSINMVNKIAAQLNIPLPDEIIKITDVASEQEIRIAKRQRNDEGKHVIPVPTFEIIKDFSGYFVDPLRIFRAWGKEKKYETMEKTVVRPTFSYLGKYYISDLAIESMVNFIVKDTEGINKVTKVGIISRPDGIVIDIDVIVNIGNIKEVLASAQIKVKEEVSRLTGLNILSINIVAKGLVIVDENKDL